MFTDSYSRGRVFARCASLPLLFCTFALAQQRPVAAPVTAQPQALQMKSLGAASPGIVEGYVYWDATRLAHNPAASCSGITATVSAAGAGPTATLGNQGSNISYLGTSSGFAVCMYAVKNMPVEQSLQVQISVNPSTVFSPAVTQVAALTVKIPGGSCNNLTPVSPTAAELEAKWSPCGNVARNVNFALLPANQLLGSRGQTMLLPNEGPGPVSSGTLLSGKPTTPPSVAKIGVGTKLVRAPQPKLGAAKLIAKITNSGTTQQNTSIIAVLQKQRQGAEAEAAQMKLLLPAQGIETGSLRTMSATAMSGSPTGVAQQPPVSAQGAQSSASIPKAILTAPGPNLLQNLVVTCSHDPSMRVLTVSGGPQPAIFTQDAQYNFYTISGCSFGNIGPNARAYIYYQGTFHADFVIEQWSDNWIKLHLDSNLSGADDQNNVTLVVQRADGTQAAKSGFRFYAARETVLLSQIPKSDFSLNRFRPDSAATNSWVPTYTSGSSSSVTPNLNGYSAEVHWDLGFPPNNKPVGGSDIYTFNGLHSSFALDSASLAGVNLSCTDSNYNQFVASQNAWSIDWYMNTGIQVSWQGQECNNSPGSCGGFMQGDCFAPGAESNYGVDVWVRGPRGIDPWTGKPVP